MIHRRLTQEKGVTLVELIVVMVATAILVTLVLSTWGVVHKTIFEVRRKMVLDFESRTFVKSIASQIRRGRGVVECHDMGITFLSYNGDTVKYTYEWDEIMRNDKAIKISPDNRIICNFNILSEMTQVDNKRAALYTFSITIANDRSDTSSYTASVASFYLNLEDDIDDDWGF